MSCQPEERRVHSVNSGTQQAISEQARVAEMVRVTKPGGTVAARMAAGPVVTEPGENPSPYRPTNLVENSGSESMQQHIFQ